MFGSFLEYLIYFEVCFSIKLNFFLCLFMFMLLVGWLLTLSWFHRIDHITIWFRYVFDFHGILASDCGLYLIHLTWGPPSLPKLLPPTVNGFASWLVVFECIFPSSFVDIIQWCLTPFSGLRLVESICRGSPWLKEVSGKVLAWMVDLMQS